MGEGRTIGLSPNSERLRSDPRRTSSHSRRDAAISDVAGTVLSLQRLAGNRAVLKLFTGPRLGLGSDRVVQRVQVAIQGVQKNLAALSVDDMIWYLQRKKTQVGLLGGAGLILGEIADVNTWIGTFYAGLTAKRRREVNGLLAVLSPASIPHAARVFAPGSVTLARGDINIAAQGGGKRRISPVSSYYIDAGAGNLHLYHGDSDLGHVRYSIVNQQIGVETINVRDTSQGSNLSRVLMAAFCAYAIAHGATMWKLNTEDTSGGWWAQWGTTNLAGVLSRGDMQNIVVPQGF